MFACSELCGAWDTDSTKRPKLQDKRFVLNPRKKMDDRTTPMRWFTLFSNWQSEIAVQGAFMSINRKVVILVSVLASSLSLMGADVPKQSQPVQSANDAVSVSIFDQEAKLVQNLRNYSPLMETYIQNMK